MGHQVSNWAMSLFEFLAVWTTRVIWGISHTGREATDYVQALFQRCNVSGDSYMEDSC